MPLEHWHPDEARLQPSPAGYLTRTALAACLALWMGLCAGLGNLQCGYRVQGEPFILSGALPMAHPRTAPGACDYNMAGP